MEEMKLSREQNTIVIERADSEKLRQYRAERKTTRECMSYDGMGINKEICDSSDQFSTSNAL